MWIWLNIIIKAQEGLLINIPLKNEVSAADTIFQVLTLRPGCGSLGCGPDAHPTAPSGAQLAATWVWASLAAGGRFSGVWELAGSDGARGAVRGVGSQ